MLVDNRIKGDKVHILLWAAQPELSHPIHPHHEGELIEWGYLIQTVAGPILSAEGAEVLKGFGIAPP